MPPQEPGQEPGGEPQIKDWGEEPVPMYYPRRSNRPRYIDYEKLLNPKPEEPESPDWLSWLGNRGLDFYHLATKPTVDLYHGPAYEQFEAYRKEHPIGGAVGRLGTDIVSGFSNPLAVLDPGMEEVEGLMQVAKWAGKTSGVIDAYEGAKQAWQGKTLKEKMLGAAQAALATLDYKGKILKAEEIIPHKLKMHGETIEKVVAEQREAMYGAIESLTESAREEAEKFEEEKAKLEEHAKEGLHRLTTAGINIPQTMRTKVRMISSPLMGRAGIPEESGKQIPYEQIYNKMYPPPVQNQQPSMLQRFLGQVGSANQMMGQGEVGVPYGLMGQQ